MKRTYRGCEIEVFKDYAMFGKDKHIFYSIFDDGYEVDSGYSEGQDKVNEFYQGLKSVVDEYIEEKENDK